MVVARPCPVLREFLRRRAALATWRDTIYSCIAAAGEISRFRGPPLCFHRTGHRRQLHRLLHDRPVRSASRTGERSRYPHGAAHHPSGRMPQQFLLAAVLRICARAPSRFPLWPVITTSCPALWPRGTRVGTRHHRQLFRRPPLKLTCAASCAKRSMRRGGDRDASGGGVLAAIRPS